jgi:hypothetical protein
MCDTCKKFKNCLAYLINHILFFFTKSLANTFTSLMFAALIFYIISFISPEWYRWASKWANQPLLPIAISCEVRDTYLPSNTTEIKNYKIIITFESALKHSQQVLIYDDTGHITLYDKSKNSDKRSFLFIKGAGNKYLTFNAKAKQGDLLIGKTEFGDCKFKLQYIGE